MSVWQLILLASIVVLALKVSGYLVPATVLERPMPSRIANLLTVALLAALVVTQTLASGNAIVIDARVPALVVAAGAACRPRTVHRRRRGRRGDRDGHPRPDLNATGLSAAGGSCRW